MKTDVKQSSAIQRYTSEERTLYKHFTSYIRHPIRENVFIIHSIKYLILVIFELKFSMRIQRIFLGGGVRVLSAVWPPVIVESLQTFRIDVLPPFSVWAHNVAERLIRINV
jgi:hypothetical protein